MASKKALAKQPLAKRASSPARSAVPDDYRDVLADLKLRVRAAQVRAATQVNRELVALYLHVGARVAERQATGAWGDGVVDRLAADLRAAFPGVSGFSRANVFYMRQVHLAWATAPEFVQQLVGRIPWGHHLVLLTKLEDVATRTFYLQSAVEHGWSRAVLTAQIASKLHARAGTAVTNFAHTLPAPDSDLAQQILKDPYTFDFLTFGPEARERDLEQGLVDHIQRFLLELGVGFAFVGRQVRLEVGGQEYFLDLLFYHLKLRAYVVVELKAGAFEPEYAGKLNFYLSAADDLLRHPDDRPSIGLLLCKERNKLVVEYALRDVVKPIGVAQWETKLVESLPERLKGSLPTVEEIEAELAATGGPPAGGDRDA